MTDIGRNDIHTSGEGGYDNVNFNLTLKPAQKESLSVIRSVGRAVNRVVGWIS